MCCRTTRRTLLPSCGVNWFQDDFAFPIDPYVLSQFAVIE